MKNWLFVFAAVALSLGSCNYVTGKRIKGNGNVMTVERPEGPFTGVESGGSFETFVGIGPQSIKIEAEENIIPYIETFVDHGVLHIKTKDGFWIKTDRDLKVYVTAPHLNTFAVNGSGGMIGTTKIVDSGKIDIEVHGNADISLDVDAPEVESNLTGNGSIEVKGETRDFRSKATGNGHIKAMELKAENAKVSIYGNGDADLFASVKIDVTIGGNGSVRYKGNAQPSTHITGNGSIQKVD